MLLSAQAPAPATVTFTFDFPGSVPEHYSFSVESTGRATYQSRGKLAADTEASDPFNLDFILSKSTRARIFEQAARARYFEGPISYNKKGLAFTGAKTLTYKDAQRNTQATYNYSLDVAVQQLTRLFQAMATTLEFGRRLEYFHRYQKLALDEELKRMEEMAKDNSLEELQAVEPILRQIVTDQSVMNVVRARAQRLLNRAGASVR